MIGLLFAIGLALLLATLPGTIELLLVTFPALFKSRKSLLRAPDTSSALEGSLLAAPGAPSISSIPGGPLLAAPGAPSISSILGGHLRLAVVTPAHNEAQDLPATLTSLLACEAPLDAADLHVIADNCTDETAAIARQYGCTVLERQNETLRGKGYALNFAFEQLKGKGYDVFLVVDADTRVNRNFFLAMRKAFSNGAAAAQAGYRVGNPEAGFRPRLMHIAFLAFNYLRPLSRRQAGFSAGIFGNGFALSADTLAAVPYDSFSIVEDLEYHVRLVRSGRKVEFLADTCVWSDMPVTSAEAQSQRERWEGGRFRMVLDLAPQLLKDIIGKKNTALIEPLLELLLMPLSYHIGMLLVISIIGLIVASGLLSIYGLLGLSLIVLHVVIAMLLGNATSQDWKALITAPFYMLWKFAKLGSIVKSSSKDTEWKRTSRDGENAGSVRNGEQWTSRDGENAGSVRNGEQWTSRDGGNAGSDEQQTSRDGESAGKDK